MKNHNIASLLGITRSRCVFNDSLIFPWRTFRVITPKPEANKRFRGTEGLINHFRRVREGILESFKLQEHSH